VAGAPVQGLPPQLLRDRLNKPVELHLETIIKDRAVGPVAALVAEPALLVMLAHPTFSKF
jgi:hypothetical protein